MSRAQSFSKAFQAYQIANDSSMYRPRTVQMSLRHYLNEKLVFSDRKGNPLHIDYHWVMCLNFGVPYIALPDGSALEVPGYYELFPSNRPFDKAAYSLANFLPGAAPPHRNKKVWDFCKMLPEGIDKQYTLAEMMHLYGCSDLKLIESGAVMVDLLWGLCYTVVIPGEEMFEPF